MDSQLSDDQFNELFNYAPDLDVDQYRGDLYVGQIRLNLSTRRMVRLTHVEVVRDSNFQPKVTVSVEDLLEPHDIYWISPRKLGPPVSEMEALAWVANTP